MANFAVRITNGQELPLKLTRCPRSEKGRLADCGAVYFLEEPDIDAQMHLRPSSQDLVGSPW